jgi:hypothetical protein
MIPAIAERLPPWSLGDLPFLARKRRLSRPETPRSPPRKRCRFRAHRTREIPGRNTAMLAAEALPCPSREHRAGDHAPAAKLAA